jgi:hypothetical protein
MPWPSVWTTTLTLLPLTRHTHFDAAKSYYVLSEGAHASLHFSARR